MKPIALTILAALMSTLIGSPAFGHTARTKVDQAPRPTPDARMIYVSPTGSDTASGLAPDQAVQTLERGFALLRDGRGDWLLLERGHRYAMPQRIERPNGSANTPLVIAAWGDGTAPDLNLGPNTEEFTPSRLRDDYVTISGITISGVPANWKMDALAWHVQPLTHAQGDRLPLFAWNLPISRGDVLVTQRNSGQLETYLEQLAERGLVPTVDLGWHWSWLGALALANSLENAELPVYLLIPQVALIEEYAWLNNTVWVNGPDASQGGRDRQWPCLPLAEIEHGAAQVDGLIKPFSDRSINLSGVWFDDESLPHPWNGVYEAQQSTAQCRSHYPAGVLDTVEEFKRWTFELRADLSSGIMAQPVHSRFPDALVGNYRDYIYHEGSSETWGFNPVTPRQLGDMQVQMPSAYALPSQEQLWLDEIPSITPLDADRLHFWRHLTIVSRCAANKLPDTRLIPYVNRIHHFDGPSQSDGRYLGMSRAAFREFLRHAILRGADTFYVFNLGHHPNFEVTPEQSFGMLDDARAVYNEMLALREFWDRGEPINFQTPTAPENPEGWATQRPEITVWSGLRLGDRCLIRAYTLEDSSRDLTVEPWPGVPIVVTATRTPRYLILSRDGTIETWQSENVTPAP